MSQIKLYECRQAAQIRLRTNLLHGGKTLWKGEFYDVVSSQLKGHTIKIGKATKFVRRADSTITQWKPYEPV